MYLKSGSIILDFDMFLLEDVLKLLEEELIKVNFKIEIARKDNVDLDSSGLLDKGEHIIGFAFTACQKYMSSTFRQSGLDKENAFKLGPIHASGESCARIINAAANYWKHCDEWDTITAVSIPDSEMMEIIIRNYERLEKNAKHTVNIIEKASSWSDYACSNILAAIIATEKTSVLKLITILLEWRNALMETKAS